MDFALCKALNRLNGIQKAVVLYDIACQYSVNFSRRIAESSSLALPPNLQIIWGIGLFHIHAHQDSCTPRYSPNYVPGVGQVDGEILETLWSSLNEISGSTRSMTAAHRREVLDDHMLDNNWKKMLRIGGCLFTPPNLSNLMEQSPLVM
jgi:Kyakuja-Dileera-Zisupton transposase